MFYIVGLLFVMFGRRHLRLGDLAAGTVLALERAPFLEKLGATARHGDDAWHDARQRAAALSRRRGSDVDDALAVVDDYRRAAHASAPRGTRAIRAARPRNTSKPRTPICTTPSTGPRAAFCAVLWSLLRDQVPAAMRAMRVHLLAVTLLFVVSAVAGVWLVYSYPGSHRACSPVRS